MLHHYLRMMVRVVQKNKTTFFINLIGLSSGLACVLLIALWVQSEMNVDAFDRNDARLYQVMENSQNSDGITTQPSTPDLLADAMADAIPEIEYATAVTPSSWFGNFTLSANEKNIKAIGQFAGKDFFRVFSYPLTDGNPASVLSGDNAIMISDQLAKRLFGTAENVIGKPIEWQLLGFTMQSMVTGVFVGVPPNSTEQFDFVLSFDQWLHLCTLIHRSINWGNHGPSTFVLLRKDVEVAQCNQKIAGFLKSKASYSNVTLFLRRFSDSYLYNTYENGVQSGGRIEYVRVFSIIALFILLIACINFMNLSTAKAAGRMREVGIRKAIGAPRKALVFQFLGESLLMTLAASIMALLLVELVLPEFSAITGKELMLDVSASGLLMYIGITLFTGLVAGSYPALYMSGFRPAEVLKGGLKGSGVELWARKGLVVFQFALSIIFLVGIMVVYRQMQFIQSKNLGYNKDNVLYFAPEGSVAQHLDAFISELRGIPGVVSAASVSQNIIGLNSSTYGLDWEGKDPRSNVLFMVVRVGSGFIETLGIHMNAGRPFATNFGSDTSAIILNEAAISVMGLKDPLGKAVTLWGRRRQIVGVTNDFNFESLHEPVKPMILVPESQNSLVIMARVQAGRITETIDRLQKFYRSYNPGYSFDFKFLDQDVQALYTSEQRVAVLSRYFAGMAIIISCLGLFGLATFTAERRLKEIGIRKVLGATVLELIYLLSKDLAGWVVMANVLAWPVAYYFMNAWLQGFAFRVTMGIAMYIVAGGAALLIAIATMSFQAIRAASANPVEALRYE